MRPFIHHGPPCKISIRKIVQHERRRGAKGRSGRLRFREGQRTGETGSVPLHAPLQPVKVSPVLGVAVRVTTVSCGKSARQVVLGMVPTQARPAGLLVTIPLPVTVATRRLGGGGR